MLRAQLWCQTAGKVCTNTKHMREEIQVWGVELYTTLQQIQNPPKIISCMPQAIHTVGICIHIARGI